MFLDRIVEVKRIEVQQRREQVSLEALLDRDVERKSDCFLEAIQRPAINVIAEIKYRSPSHGPFLLQDAPQEIASMYVNNGAAAISVLTDETFFGGSLEYLRMVADSVRSEVVQGEDNDPRQAALPLLCKDFIVSRYQIVEAALAGASAYLLIAACLSPEDLNVLLECGREHGMEALVEVHNLRELEMVVESEARVIGVNNRDLRSFEVNINTSFEIARRLEGEERFALVAESGISERSLIEELRDAGYDAFLVGTALMDSAEPARQLRDLVGTG